MRLFERYPLDMTNNHVHHVIRIDLSTLKDIIRKFPDQVTRVVYTDSTSVSDYQLTVEQHNLLIAKVKESSILLKEQPTMGTVFHFFIDGINRAS